MANGKWYYVFNNAQQGPVSEEELRSFFASDRLPLKTLVWCATLANWTAASEVANFKDAKASVAVAVSQQTSPAPGNGQHQSASPAPAQQSPSHAQQAVAQVQQLLAVQAQQAAPQQVSQAAPSAQAPAQQPQQQFDQYAQGQQPVSPANYQQQAVGYQPPLAQPNNGYEYGVPQPAVSNPNQPMQPQEPVCNQASPVQALNQNHAWGNQQQHNQGEAGAPQAQDAHQQPVWGNQPQAQPSASANSNQASPHNGYAQQAQPFAEPDQARQKPKFRSPLLDRDVDDLPAAGSDDNRFVTLGAEGQSPIFLADHVLMPHPWHRFFARGVDAVINVVVFCVISFILFATLGATTSGASETASSGAALVVLGVIGAIWMFSIFLLEPLWYCVLGTTPGKALFGIRLRDARSGNKLSFGQAFYRTMMFYVFTGRIVGFLPGIGPLTVIICQVVQYNRLGSQRITNYDEMTNVRYEHINNSPNELMMLR